MSQIELMLLSNLNEKVENLIDVNFGDFMRRGQDDRIYEPCLD